MKRKILWLASWYPNKLEPLNGDFIERHAKAASLLHDVTVLHVVKDHQNITPGNTAIVNKHYDHYPQLRSVSCYYKSAPGLISLIKYFRLQKRLIKQYVREHGKPDLINVHISFKAGLGALYAKWKYGIPYVVSEQWTIFCPEAKPSFHDQSPVSRIMMGKIYKNASRVSAVSGYLAQSLAERFAIKVPVRIPNVVDASLFYPSSTKHEVFTFIHISVLNYQKSPDEIIDAIVLLKNRSGRPFKFVMYGPFIQSLAEKIKIENVADVIDYRQEVLQDQLAAEVRRCHSLVLYSRFETFGCVVIEALASGLPVIVSDIPVMHELVNANVNGVFAPIDDAQTLAEKMFWMIENYKSFDSKKIAYDAEDGYSFSRIAKQFENFY